MNDAQRTGFSSEFALPGKKARVLAVKVKFAASLDRAEAEPRCRPKPVRAVANGLPLEAGNRALGHLR
jgi:hypothetical protein